MYSRTYHRLRSDPSTLKDGYSYCNIVVSQVTATQASMIFHFRGWTSLTTACSGDIVISPLLLRRWRHLFTPALGDPIPLQPPRKRVWRPLAALLLWTVLALSRRARGAREREGAQGDLPATARATTTGLREEPGHGLWKVTKLWDVENF